MTSTIDNILFSSSNLMTAADSITSNQVPVTSIDWLQTSKRAQQTRFTNPDGAIYIDTYLSDATAISYFAIPGHNLPSGSTVKVQIFDESITKLYDSGELESSSLIAAGIFSAGEDEWNTYERSTLNNVFFHTFDSVANAYLVRVWITHNYTYETPVTFTETSPATVISNGILQQDTDGIVSIEAENCTTTASGTDSWVESTTVAGSSGGTYMYKNGPEFYWTVGAGPSLGFSFTAAQSGSHKIWIRMESTGGNSIYTQFDDQQFTSVYPGTTVVGQGWTWVNTGTVNLIEGREHEVQLIARDHYLSVDKIVLVPNGSSAPTGTGPDQSDTGTISVDAVSGAQSKVDFKNHVDLRMFMFGDVLQLQENFEHGIAVKFMSDPLNYKTESGYLVSGKAQNNVRTATLNLAVMNPRDKIRMVEFQRAMNGLPFMVSLYPNENGWTRDRHVFLATFVDSTSYSHDLDKIHSTTLTLHEA